MCPSAYGFPFFSIHAVDKWLRYSGVHQEWKKCEKKLKIKNTTWNVQTVAAVETPDFTLGFCMFDAASIDGKDTAGRRDVHECMGCLCSTAGQA